VERATSFIRDDLWYGIFAGMNPGILLSILFELALLYTNVH
jgi:hypothetical protein